MPKAILELEMPRFPSPLGCILQQVLRLKQITGLAVSVPAGVYIATRQGAGKTIGMVVSVPAGVYIATYCLKKYRLTVKVSVPAGVYIATSYTGAVNPRAESFRPRWGVYCNITTKRGATIIHVSVPAGVYIATRITLKMEIQMDGVSVPAGVYIATLLSEARYLHGFKAAIVRIFNINAYKIVHISSISAKNP